jgi:NAD(P)-dependent dehydrogenase (short-subunit alcohol dehydrogenase family)
MKNSAASTSDRPAGGVVHPIHGTVAAPVVVVGATGTIGRRIVRGLVGAGRAVVAIAPHRDRLESVRREHAAGAVTISPQWLRTDADASQLAGTLRALGRPIAGVVVAIATHTDRGRLIDRTTEQLRDCLDQTLLPQLAIARHLIPLLADSARNGSYVMIGRPGSEAPWAGYGHHSVAMAAVRMLAHALHDEARSLGVRVHLLSVDAPVRSGAAAAHECPEWPTADGIAQRVVELIDQAPSDAPPAPIVRCGRQSAAPGIPAFLKSLKTQRHHEVSRDDTP